jgi:tetratricopeptide (TPR) repeat protein
LRRLDPDRRSLLLGALVVSGCASAARRRDSFAASFPAYRLKASFDPRSLTLHVEGTVSIPEAAIADGVLTLALTEDARDPNLEFIDAGGRHAIELTRQERGGRELRRWTAAVPPARPDRLSFSLDIAANAATLFALTSEFVLAAGVGCAWYPQIVDRDDVRLTGTGEIAFDMPGLKLIASGAPIGGAASSPTVYRVTRPNYFDFAAGRFLEAQGSRSSVVALTLEERPRLDELALEMQRTLRALEGEFGSRPEERFQLAEAPVETARAAGFDGASLDGFMLLIGDYFEQPFNTAFFAHEASHQWWGGLVRRRGLPGAYLLDESLAQFGSLRAVEILEGAAAASAFRRIGYAGHYTEYSAFWYLARSLAGIDAPLLDLHAADPFVARRVANAKGMIVWDMLSRWLGRSRFREFLTGIVRDRRYQRITLEAFIEALRGALGPDAWLVDQWFWRTGAPTFDMQWRQDGDSLTVTVRQNEPYYRARLPIEARGETGERASFDIDIDGGQAAATRQLTFAPSMVALDPDYTILRWTPALRERAITLLPYTRGDIVLNQGAPEIAEQMFNEALAEAPAGTELGFMLLRGLADAALGQSRFQDAADRYRAALAAAPDLHEAVPDVWRALGDALRGLGDRDGIRAAAAEQKAALLRLRRALRRDPTPVP